MSDDATFRLCDIDEVPLFVLIKITSDMLLFKDNVYLLTAKTAMEMFVTKKIIFTFDCYCLCYFLLCYNYVITLGCHGVVFMRHHLHLNDNTYVITVAFVCLQSSGNMSTAKWVSITHNWITPAISSNTLRSY